MKARMISLDPAFDERAYGCRTFHDLLGRLAHRVMVVGTSGGDVTRALIDETARAGKARGG